MTSPWAQWDYRQHQEMADLARAQAEDGADPSDTVSWYGVRCSRAENAAANEALAELGIEVTDADPFATAAPSPPLALSNPAGMDLARELVAELADAGYVGEAAECYAELGGADPGEVRGTFDLSNASAELDRQFGAERAHAQAVAAADKRDAARSAAANRALSTEDRLDMAYQRIGQGTYQPLEFASPSDAARQLARARWDVTQPGPVTGRSNCGASDDLGYCISPAHDMGCGSLAETQTGEAMRDSGAYRRLASQPLRDANGRTWDDQFGRPVSLTGHIEAATGQRLGHGAAGFESGHGRRDAISPQRQPRFADPSADPGDDPGRGIPYETAATVALAREQMGLAGPDAAAVNRERYAERRVGQAMNAALSGRGLVPGRDDGETTRERNQRIAAQRGPASPRQFGEPPLHGSLPTYEAG